MYILNNAHLIYGDILVCYRRPSGSLKQVIYYSQPSEFCALELNANFRNFHNYAVIKKNIFHEIFVSIDNSKCYKHRVSLASNNEFTGVFQAIVSVLHSLHHLRGVAIAILL